jgi:hypothetical protein
MVYLLDIKFGKEFTFKNSPIDIMFFYDYKLGTKICKLVVQKWTRHWI